MTCVALYGFASATREGIWNSSADEIWSIGWAYKYSLPRIDRLLEIHPIWMQAKSVKPEYEKARNHWEWLKNNTVIPVYMTIRHPDVPMCVRYPIEDVMQLLPKERRKKVFSSSFDFLMGMAVLEGFERVEAYGFDMGSDTEYRYQREGAAYWIGYCDAMGIDLVLPDNTALLKNKLYGYEGGSMIYRQDLERMHGVRVEQKRNAYARLANLEGQLQEAERAGDEERKVEIAEEWEKQFKLCHVIDGALQENEYYLREIDLEEPTEELFDHMVRVSME